MRFQTIIVAAALALTGAACSSPKPADPDMTATEAVPEVPTDFEVDDKIDGQSDEVDFKRLKAPMTGDATVVVKFKAGHAVAGMVAVVDTEGAPVADALVTSTETDYTLTYKVTSGALHYLKVAATKGKGDYTVLYIVKEPKPVDPCEGVSCDDGEECKGGMCVELAKAECSPKCKAGLTCINGTCEKPCGGPCAKGMVCNAKKNECVKDPCYQKVCAAGEKCSGGVCKAPPAPVAKECKPACATGQTCNTKTGTCEGQATEPTADPCAGPISGSIVQVIPQGSSKTVIAINRGSKVCIKVGQTGRIAGVNGVFTITEVLEFRSKATIAVDETTIGANRGVTINR